MQPQLTQTEGMKESGQTDISVPLELSPEARLAFRPHPTPRFHLGWRDQNSGTQDNPGVSSRDCAWRRIPGLQLPQNRAQHGSNGKD